MLADEKTFDSYMKNVIMPRVTKDIIMSERAEKKYYEVNSKLTNHMRSFHNFIKTNLVSTYCSPKYIKEGEYKKLDLLDIGVGIGGDLMKYYHARIGRLTCFDPSYENIFSSVDGTMSRLTTHKRKFPDFPKTTVFIGDGGALFDLESQIKVIPTMSDINKQTIKQVFGDKYETYDIFSCQFMIHYLFASDETLNNFCSNVKKHLKKNGFLIATTTDGDIVHKSFQNEKITHYYTDGSNKKILFEYKKLYTGDNLNKTGLAIDFFNASFMAEGTYQTEYLVTPEFIINTLEEKCEMILIDTDTFENQFHKQKEFLETGAKFESNLKTRDQFNKIYQFYNMDLDDNASSYELMKLNRYYVFQKK
jgi:SAM-dependent methyltransferase